MFANYIKTAIRNILRNKLTASINIVGLAIGISCSLLIWLWVKDEMSYNRFLPDAERVYQLRVNETVNCSIMSVDYTPGPLRQALAKDVPQIQYTAKTRYSRDILFNAGDKTTKEKGNYVSDDFFRIFKLKAIDGDPDKAIRNPDQIVITRNIAEKFFNTIRNRQKN